MTDYTNLRKIVTGDIIIKCRFGKEIRRIPINQVPTYDELCLMMYRVFKADISTPENIILKYMDNEGDMISLLDDLDITHAISISSLLKVTVYDKSAETTVAQQLKAPSAEIQASLVEIRDTLDALIKSLEKVNLKSIEKSEASNKATRRLTAAELAEFLNDTNIVTNETDTKAFVKELATLSPNVNASKIPYYPPPTPLQQSQQPAPQLLSQQSQQPVQTQPPQLQQQQQQQKHHQTQQHQPSQLQQQSNVQHQQYIQTPPVSSVPQQPHQQRPVTMQQQQHPSQTSQTSSQPTPYQPTTTPQQYNNPTNYQSPPSQSNMNGDPRLQQQPLRQGYYVPPPPSSMNTPQLPPQPYNAPPRW